MKLCRFFPLLLLFLCGCGSSGDSAADFPSGSGNSPPVAVALASGQSALGAPVLLDGSGSHDPDGDPLAFRWRIDAQPAASRAVLVDPAGARPQFQPDVAGEFHFCLIVNDGRAESAPCYVVIVIGDDPFPGPVAAAGRDRTVSTGVPVVLDGSGSSAQNGPLAFAWVIIAQPQGSNVQLFAAETVNPSFVPLVPGAYQILLTVSDGRGAIARDFVVVTAVSPASNSNPIALAGPDRLAPIGTLVTLDGSSSYDPTGQPITFAWQLASRPSDSFAVIFQKNTATPFFTPDRPGEYRLTLTVRDLRGEVDTATVVVLGITGELLP